MSALYSLRSDPSHSIAGDTAFTYRITKFLDGEVEASYLVSESACECPAGHRHTCRHRQMLSTMLAHKLCDTHWFFDFDRGGQIVDFNGTSKKLFDELAAVAGPSSLEAELSRTQEETAKDTLSPALTGLQEEQILMGFHQPELCKPQGSKPWRRL